MLYLCGVWTSEPDILAAKILFTTLIIYYNKI